MSARRALAGSLTALLLPASLLLLTGPSTASVTTQVAPQLDARKASKVTIAAHPQISAQGKGVASSKKAKSVFTGQVKPAAKGRPVQLQIKSGGGWKKAAQGVTGAKGKIELSGKAKSGAQYRFNLPAFKGAKGTTSKPVSLAPWQLTPAFADEFSGSTLGSIWSPRGDFHSAESLRACSTGDPRASKVSGGTLRLTVMKDPDRTDKCVALKNGKSSGKYAYRLNGHVGTQGSFGFKYGYAAARVKMHKSRGQHASFWMQPNPANSQGLDAKQGGAEVDIIEYFGDKHPNGGLTSFTYSHPGGGAQKKNGSWIKNSTSFLANKKDGWSKNYHVFSVEWTPKEYIFRIDGKETWRTKVGVSGVEQYVILSMLSSDYALNLGGDKVLPQTTQVDWVKVWTQQPFTGAPVTQ